MDNINVNINVETKNKENRIIYEFLKRTLDIMGSLCRLILLSPVIMIISILIKSESNGPIFFVRKELD